MMPLKNRNDKPESPASALAEAAARYPEHGRIQYWLGAVQVGAGQPEAALPALQAAVSLQPTFSEAQLKLSEVLASLGRQAEAEALLRALLDRDPVHHPGAWNNLGFLLLQAQRFAEAEEALGRAVALDPDLATAWVNLGSIKLLQQDYEGALDPLERAVAADPAYVPALGNLGLVYMNLGRTDRARAMFEQVLQYQPGDPRARSMLNQLSR
jgi:tetratricopeptide (TPR) repeat protein